jgi:lipopolysaccharide export LptBFGC system permease protein LptF
MRIYEKYFARQIYLAFIFILFAFSGLFFFFDLINELNTVGHGNYKFGYAVLRVALQTPSRFYEIIPVAALISAIYVFAQMAASSEYTIFRVSGLATGQALRSLLKIGIPIVALTYFIGEVVGPYTDQLSERVRLEALGSAVSTNFASGVWVKDTLGARENGERITRFVNVGELMPDTSISNVRIYEFDPGFRLTNIRIAQSGRYQGNGHWLLKGVTDTELTSIAPPDAHPADALNPVYRAAQTTLPEYSLRSDVQPVPVYPAFDRESAGHSALRHRTLEKAALSVRRARHARAVAAVRVPAYACGCGRREGIRWHHARHELSAHQHAFFAYRHAHHMARADDSGHARTDLPRARLRGAEVGRSALTFGARSS